MSLKGLHIVFIIASIVLSLFFGAWALKGYFDGGSRTMLWYAVGGFVCGAALIAYARSVLKKLNELRGNSSGVSGGGGTAVGAAVSAPRAASASAPAAQLAQPPAEPKDASAFIRRSDKEPTVGLDDLRRNRREFREGDRLVIQEGNRLIVREGDRTFIRHNALELIRGLRPLSRLELALGKPDAGRQDVRASPQNTLKTRRGLGPVAGEAAGLAEVIEELGSVVSAALG